MRRLGLFEVKRAVAPTAMLMLFGALLLAPGCGESTAPTASEGAAAAGGGNGGGGGAGAEELTIAVIPKGTSHSFWKTVHAGAVKASREFGVDIVWQGPPTEDDRRGQISVVENHINAGTDAIVLAPLDAQALVGPVAAAMQRGTPVIIIDSDIDREGVTPDSFVATDNYVGGTLAGQKMVELLGGEGNIIMLRYMVGSNSTDQRERGFMDEIAKHPGIKVLSENQYAGATPQTSLEKAGSLLNSLQGEKLDGVYCPNESSTFGMLRALEERGMAKNVVFVGFDASEKLNEALMKDHIDALIVQNPFHMGYLGVKTAVQKLRGEEIADRVDTGCHVMTRENIDSPELAEIVNPPLEEYLGISE